MNKIYIGIVIIISLIALNLPSNLVTTNSITIDDDDLCCLIIIFFLVFPVVFEIHHHNYRKCPHCGRETEADRETCPHCGGNLR